MISSPFNWEKSDVFRVRSVRSNINAVAAMIASGNLIRLALRISAVFSLMANSSSKTSVSLMKLCNSLRSSSLEVF